MGRRRVWKLTGRVRVVFVVRCDMHWPEPDFIDAPTAIMKKIVRLTESDLARIVKRVINEGNDDTIKIPKKFKALRMEIGDESTPSEIKKLWNKYVLPDTMGDTPKLSSFEDGKFVNADGKSLPVSAILDELNYAFSDEEDEDDDM